MQSRRPIDLPTDTCALPSPIGVATWVGLTSMAALALGALGSHGLPIPESADLYGRTVRAVAGAPPWIGHGFQVVSELGLVLLAAAFALAGWRYRHRADAVSRVLAGGVGVVIAYVMSELLKVRLVQPRPCLGLDPGVAIAACPAADDWSLPSNHATIAIALAVALVFAIPRAAWWAVPLALAVGAARVVIGVHAPHDVATGALLAAAVVTVATLALQRPAQIVACGVVDRGWLTSMR